MHSCRKQQTLHTRQPHRPLCKTERPATQRQWQIDPLATPPTQWLLEVPLAPRPHADNDITHSAKAYKLRRRTTLLYRFTHTFTRSRKLSHLSSHTILKLHICHMTRTLRLRTHDLEHFLRVSWRLCSMP